MATNTISKSVQEVTWYFTQYANYMFDDDAIEFMTPYFEQLEEDGADISALLDQHDDINKCIFDYLSTISADAINEILTNFDEHRQELFNDHNVEAYTADTWWEIADADLKANGMDANAIYWADDLRKCEFDGTLYELNGYGNELIEVDIEDYITAKDVCFHIKENF